MKYYPVILLLSLLALSCADSTNPNIKPTKTNKTKTATDHTTANSESNKSNMKNQIKTFLTFQDNNAENAMNFYVELFPNSKVTDLQRWGKGTPGEEGKIMFATFELNGSPFMCSDSPPIHDWNFSPAVSNYLDCDNEVELERLFSKLSENGTITMPLNNYGFSQKFGWVIDQFGISWQLNLP